MTENRKERGRGHTEPGVHSIRQSRVWADLSELRTLSDREFVFSVNTIINTKEKALRS